jgi:hypothetical protein
MRMPLRTSDFILLISVVRAFHRHYYHAAIGDAAAIVANDDVGGLGRLGREPMARLEIVSAFYAARPLPQGRR